ncbi:MAG: efflux RND transporter periplasmic adaptor subunit [Oleispira sp.]|nr:efflux RND transporter periplasmic adaptor subunit [Oleispira sp.]
MKKLVIAVACIIVVVVSIKLWPAKVVEITVVAVGLAKVESLVSNTRSGTVKACQRSKLSLAMGGQVNHLHVDQGDHVVAGELLLELWNDDLTAALAQARAQVKVVQLNQQSACHQAQADKRELKRISELQQKNLASTELLDHSQTSADIMDLSCQQHKAQVIQAQANAAVQQARLAHTQLRAPFAGIIADVHGEIGEYATPSPPGVATPPAIDLINDQCVYISAPIDEVDAARIQLGMRARVSLDAFREQVFSGQVKRIAPYVKDNEKQARTVDIDVELSSIPEEVKLLVGYSADMEIIIQQEENVLSIPTDALIEGNHVLVLSRDGETLEKVELQLGLSNWNWTQVITGLSLGQKVLTSLGNPAAVAGVRVKVVDSL